MQCKVCSCKNRHVFFFLFLICVFRCWVTIHLGYLRVFTLDRFVGGGALLAGLKEEWVHESLVKTLKDFDQLQPKDPSGQAVATQLLL